MERVQPEGTATSIPEVGAPSDFLRNHPGW